ncbi:MAG: glycosyl hydrolase [Pseudomonadota bacterium]
MAPRPHFAHQPARLLRTLALGVQCCALLACASAPPPPVAQATAPQHRFVYGPYKHLNMAVNPQNPVATTQVLGTPQVLASTPRAVLMPAASALTLAFASGECGQEKWGDLAAQAVADANIAALNRAGLPYIISTGGEGNIFTCGTDAAMEQFVTRYASPMLLGFDFDIEAGQTPEMVRSLLQRIKVAQVRRPHLRMSFTVATYAASDTGQASLNAQGQQVLAAIRAVQLDNYFINLMVMNYGPAKTANCVVREGRCDMAASAAQAVQNLHSRYGIPKAQIEVTAMLGINDVVENVFTPADATALARLVRQEQLGGLHFWSLDRDGPCAGGATAVSPTCSSLNAHSPLAFSKAFAEGLR